MARMRTVKPEFFRSATIGRLSRDVRLLFIGMWTEADDLGRGLAEPRHLAGSLFAFDRDVTERKIRAWLRELEQVVCSDGKRGLIVLYESSGTMYYAIRSWWHQNVNRPGAPRYPAPPEETLFTEHSVNAALQNAPPDALKGTRQGSGFRVQGSGSESGLIATGSESVSDDAAPDSPAEAEISHLNPRQRLAVEALTDRGKTLVGALELVEAIGADAVLAKFSEKAV